jgi:hypothetical protein
VADSFGGQDIEPSAAKERRELKDRSLVVILFALFVFFCGYNFILSALVAVSSGRSSAFENPSAAPLALLQKRGVIFGPVCSKTGLTCEKNTVKSADSPPFFPALPERLCCFFGRLVK